MKSFEGKTLIYYGKRVVPRSKKKRIRNKFIKKYAFWVEISKEDIVPLIREMGSEWTLYNVESNICSNSINPVFDLYLNLFDFEREWRK